MDNVLLLVVILLILGLALSYVYKAKKSGKKCIGCPYADSCGTKSCTCKKD